MPCEKDDASLVRAALAGDPTAFEALAHRYRDAAFGIAFHQTGDFEAARDLAQQALLTAWVQLPMLREPARFGHWLYRITTMAGLNALRRHRCAVPLDAPEVLKIPREAADPAEVLQRAEKARQVREALAVLSESDRLAVILHYVSGYSHEEIGHILDASVSAVKNRIHRARRRLREEMLVMVESNMKSAIPLIEFDERLVRASLERLTEEFAILLRVPAARLGYTERTRDAIRKVASELAEDGCRWLVGPPHIPDGSPALPLLRSLGFQVETEMHWYERSLAGRLPSAKPLGPDVKILPLAEADPAQVALLQAAVRKRAPEAIDETMVRHMQTDPDLFQEASLAAYVGERLAAVVSVFAVREANMVLPKFDPDTGVLWDRVYDPEIGSAPLLKHLLAIGLPAMKRAGLKTVVSEQTRPDLEEAFIRILKDLGFRYVRSIWNVKLNLETLKGETNGTGKERGGLSDGEVPEALKPLTFRLSEREGDTVDITDLRIDVKQVLGEGPSVGPGDVFMVTGDYTLEGPIPPLLELAGGDAYTGPKVPLFPGTHAFGATTRILTAAAGRERTLRLNLVRPSDETIPYCIIELT